MRAVLFVALSLLSLGAVSAQQTCAGLEIGRIYTATSPLTVATLTANNWTLCAMVPFDVSVSPDIPQFRIPACSQFSHLIIGCRATNAPALTVAAGAPYATIFTESPPTSAGNIVGSASFYYTTGFSMGFAPAGQPVDRDQCDKFDSTANNRLCYEMVAAGGRDGRCGAGANIGPSKNVFRVAYGT